jgi:hypothetical protein
MARSVNVYSTRCNYVSAAVLCCALLLYGCGNNLGNAASKPLFVSDCDGAATATDLVILKWSGGTSKIYPDDAFPGLDFASFDTADGGTLADAPEDFKDAVRREVVQILCDRPAISVAVQNEKERLYADATTIYVVHAPSQVGGGQIGEGEFDPCNLQHDNSALIFGDELRDLPGPYTFDDWVLIFANVAAHEIGHTLGFNHVPRSEPSDSEHMLYVELMLAGHTVNEMIRPQRFLSDETNCPGAAARSRRNDPAVFTCGLTE